MARILIGGNSSWFEELRAVSYYLEADVERWILQHARSVFPHHYVFPFKMDIVSRTSGASKTPDLALVRRDFRAWAIVEVELRKHAIGHVLEQTGVFADGNYNVPEIAEYTKRQLHRYCDKTVSLKRLTTLVSSEPPSVLVVADEHSSEWETELGRTGIDFCIFEVYKSVGGRYVYRTFGKYPSVISQEAHVRRSGVANTFEVVGPFTFTRTKAGGRIEVTFEDVLTQWAVIENDGTQYIRFLGTSNPLSPNETYGLLRDRSHRYFFNRS